MRPAPCSFRRVGNAAKVFVLRLDMMDTAQIHALPESLPAGGPPISHAASASIDAASSKRMQYASRVCTTSRPSACCCTVGGNSAFPHMMLHVRMLHGMQTFQTSISLSTMPGSRSDETRSSPTNLTTWLRSLRLERTSCTARCTARAARCVLHGGCCALVSVASGTLCRMLLAASCTVCAACCSTCCMLS